MQSAAHPVPAAGGEDASARGGVAPQRDARVNGDATTSYVEANQPFPQGFAGFLAPQVVEEGEAMAQISAQDSVPVPLIQDETVVPQDRIHERIGETVAEFLVPQTTKEIT